MPPKKSKQTSSGKTVDTHGKSTPGRSQTVAKKPQQTLKQQKKVSSNMTKASCSSRKDQKAGKSKTSNKELVKTNKAATIIQKMVRGYLAKKYLSQLKQRKKDYHEEMEKIQKQAWLDMVQRQREEDEKQRKKEEEERKRKKEEHQWRKIILEAAFDGELQTILETIQKAENAVKSYSKLNGEALDQFVKVYKMKLIECLDANGNSLLSEASAGGDVDTILFLLKNGANVNSEGHYKRTPLYRSAFGGHFDAVQLLLEWGGDPRKLDNDGMTATEVAPTKEIIDVLSNWDLEKTDQLIYQLQNKEEKKIADQKKFADMLKENVEKKLKVVEKEYESKQKKLLHAHAELAKRIEEHDRCVAQGFDKTEVTLKAIHLAEEELIQVELEEKRCRSKLDEARLELRDSLQAPGEEENGCTCVKHHVRQLDDVLMRDVGDKIKSSGKWPFLIDTSAQAVTFLKYRDTNYVNVLNPQNVQADSLRIALLGAIRYGKPLVLDMMEINMMDFLRERFAEIQENLFDDLVSKELLQNERYLTLIRNDDGDEYSKDKFLDSRVKNFKLIVVTKMWHVPKEFGEMFYAIKIIISEV